MSVDILIVDDEKNIRDILASVMNDEGYKARVASNSDEALSEFNKINPSVVILDVWLNNSKMDGVEILSEFKSINKDIPVIMMSGHGTVDMAVSATKKGAYDFIAKPFRTEALLSTIARALDTVKLKTQVDILQNQLGVGGGEIIGVSSYVRNLNKQILKNSNSQISLIFGDTGTGKEVVVQNLYKQKSTDKDLFVFDCNMQNLNNVDQELFGAKGFIQKSLNSVLVFDNLQMLGFEVQQKILDHIKNNKNLSVIFVANDKNLIHPDLLNLCKKSTIETKSLNDRIEDIESLTKEFLKHRSVAKRQKVKEIDQEAITVLMNHNWKNNIWELLNIIDNLLINVDSDIITAQDVKNFINKNTSSDSNIGMENILMMDLKKSREEFEKYYLSFHLKRFNSNITQTSEFIGMDRAALSRKIKSLKING